MDLDPQKLTEKEKEVYERLKEVRDPEFGFSITEAGMIDEVKVEGKVARIAYHLTAPFCPPIFALHIGRQIKRMAKEVQGIEEVHVTVRNHFQSEEINEALSKMP
ncbi:iron-sulfur cluster assembly protein [Candidatus Bathyarchaeota archaeon]|nr:iron-sulfur cluster assembly protein [Candidatus Bathyarchaeota archaeon]MBS7628164.1 iron-sulfur cluster assembly protein [Candidatus Bathyarchaeota archaeon]